MVNAPLPKVKDLDALATSILNSEGKGISLPDFISYATKCKELLEILSVYGMITKDDLSMAFGLESDGIPDCDSDLEREVVRKGVAELNAVDIHSSLPSANVHKFSALLNVALAGAETSLFNHIAPAKKSEESEERQADAEPPNANLQLEYVHGYRSMDTRNNLRYNKEGDIVYHTASVGVVLNQGLNTQRHFFEHTADVVCLAMHPNMIHVATGDVAAVPKICVWDSVTAECLARITGLLNKGISNLTFSPDGTYLAASAADENHCVAIYDWDKCTTGSKNVANKSKKNNHEALIGTGQLTSAHVFQLLFNPSGDQLVATALGEVNFVSFWGGAVRVQKGECPGAQLEKRPDAQALLCAAYLGTALVTGCFDGRLLIWKGKRLSHCFKAHDGPVNTIWGRPNLDGVITGSSDGTVKVWDQSLNQIKSVDTVMNVEVRKISIGQDKSIGCLNVKVSSVCEKTDGNILIGTRGGDIIEITKNNPKVLIRSHYKYALKGLATNPKKAEYATVDQSGLFSVWDIETRKQKLVRKLDCGGDTITFSSDGKQVAIGLLNGEIRILNSEFKVAATRKNTASAILELKFSHDNSMLIASAADSRIYLYEANRKFILAKKFKAIGAIVHIDFSENSEFIQTVTASGQFHCFALDKEKTSQDTKSLKWETYNCTTGPLLKGTQAPSFLKEAAKCVDVSKDESIAVLGSSSGLIKLYRFPCVVESIVWASVDSSYKTFRGHAGVVAGIKFTAGSEYLVSIGASDRTIFQWKFNKDDAKPIKSIEDFKDDELIAGIQVKGKKPATSEDSEPEAAKKRRLISSVAHSKPKEFKPSRRAVIHPAIVGRHARR